MMNMVNIVLKNEKWFCNKSF